MLGGSIIQTKRNGTRIAFFLSWMRISVDPNSYADHTCVMIKR